MLAGSISKFKIDFIFSGLTESGCHDIEKTTTNSFVVQLILLAPSCGRKKNSLNFPLSITYSRRNRTHLSLSIVPLITSLLCNMFQTNHSYAISTVVISKGGPWWFASTSAGQKSLATAEQTEPSIIQTHMRLHSASVFAYLDIIRTIVK